jgi:hypothetical protein
VYKYGKYYHIECSYRYCLLHFPGSEFDENLVGEIGTELHDPAEDIDPEIERRVIQNSKRSFDYRQNW